MTLPFVTVISPVRDEARTLPASLRSILAQDWPPDRLEVLVVDGASRDGTAELARELARSARCSVRVLDNPRQTAAAGLNVGVRASRGAVIVRIDGHAEAASDFVRRSVEALERTHADCVGGPIRTVGEGAVGRATAAAMSSRFGVGNAAFRTSRVRETDVDTVAFPAYRRDVFDRVGLFDEAFVRNQDDEFHLRLVRAGGRVVLTPGIASTYRCRGTLGGLARQYFEYGRWKPLVYRKHGRRPSARALAPPTFVAALVAGAAATFATSDAVWFLAVAGPYVVASLVASTAVAARHGIHLLPRLPFAFATLHLSYGAGFWVGLAIPRRETESERIRRVFARRDAAPRPDDPRRAALVAARNGDLLKLLSAEGMKPIRGTRILDVGCGRGDSLVDFAAAGVAAFGVDLLPERVAAARSRLPQAHLAAAEAANLPFRDGTFDLCLLFTVLSSILDDELRRRVAAESIRVLRPGGAVVLYEFASNPLNRDVRGVRARTLARLFPGCRVVVRRSSGPISWLPTHYVALVRPPQETA